MVRLGGGTWFFVNVLVSRRNDEPAFWYAVVMARHEGRDLSQDRSGVAGKPSGNTWQTRIGDYAAVERAAGDAALAAYAELYGRVERKLFAAVAADRTAASLKGEYLKQHGIPARMFNGVRVSLEGKIASVQEQQKVRVDSLRGRITQAEKQIDLAVQRGRLAQAHQKRRRLSNLRHRLVALETDVTSGRVRLCFGSKRLWHRQHDLAANGYDSHTEWLSDWRDARSDEFFVLGSRDETGGCQLCVASVAYEWDPDAAAADAGLPG